MNKMGRPNLPKEDLKKHCSIRLMDKHKKMLIKIYGSVQKAIEFLIKQK